MKSVKREDFSGNEKFVYEVIRNRNCASWYTSDLHLAEKQLQENVGFRFCMFELHKHKLRWFHLPIRDRFCLRRAHDEGRFCAPHAFEVLALGDVLLEHLKIRDLCDLVMQYLFFSN